MTVIAKENLKLLIESLVKTYLKNGGDYDDVFEIFKEINDGQPTS